MSRVRVPLIDVLHVFALSSFAVAQPIFDLLGRNATFFPAHDSSGGQILLFTVLVLMAPPAIIIGAELITASVSTRARHHVHALFIGALGGLTIAPPVIRTFQLGTPSTLVVYATLSVLVWLGYQRLRAFRTLVTWVTPAPIVFAGIFLLLTPVRQIAFPNVPTASQIAEGTDTPVVVVVFDELNLSGLLTPEGEINRERFPNFGRLADTATWYPKATTVHDHTPVAVTSVLTGKLPPHEAVPTASAFPENLFTMLGGQYDLRVEEVVTHLCPEDLCDNNASPGQFTTLIEDTLLAFLHTAFPEDLKERVLPSIDNRWAGFADGSETEDPDQSLSLEDIRASTTEILSARQEHVRLENFLEHLAPTNQPTLYFLHSILPHSPWRYLPTGQAYENDFFGDLFRDGRGGFWRDSPIHTNQGIQRFLLQTQYVDRFIGLMLDRLEAIDLLDRSMLVVLADHGISFRPGLSRRNLHHGGSPGEILSIPLFIKLPNQAQGAVSGIEAQTVDILPTIADALEIDPTWDLHGSSLLDMEANRGGSMLVTADGIESIPDGVWEDAISRASEYAETFGTGEGSFDVYALGPYRDIAGTPVKNLRLSQPLDSVVARVDNIERLESVDRDALTTPSRVTGTIDQTSNNLHIAASLNGQIVATGITYHYPEDNEWRFSLFIPPDLFENGCNTVTLYQISMKGHLSEIPQIRSTSCC